ncbi:MAG: hypothetical protein OXH00_17085 [Candidatus Poribacteria bacterium]|nr:hypothetical protein [Candidatus Poribacteria bacterium]
MRLKSIFFITLLMLICGTMCSLFAKAPTTPKILFTSTRDGNREIYVMNPDGSEQVNLTQHRAEDLQAVWSPTGEEILFVSDRDGIRDLYLMNPDGSNVRRVFKKFVYRYYPTWSPDGKQIAYMHKAHDLRASIIYIATLGKPKEESFVNALYPAWSPDRTEIACSVGGLGQEGRLALINIRTGEREHLLPVNEKGGQSFPSWSAAGDKLAFSWNNNPLPPLAVGEHVPDAWLDKLTIYIINRDGTGLRQIVDEAGPRAMAPTLSPNGEEVLYTQEINENLQIFKVDVDSGVRTQLTRIKRNFGADWFDPAYTLPVSPQPALLTTTWGELKMENRDGRK